MLREIVMRKEYLQDAAIETIYFGGGTPSLLTADEINRIIEAVHEHYTVNKLVECTLEANPDDLNKAYIKSLGGTPINRFSIGVQSFRDEDLLYMKRAHNASEADYAIKAAQDGGFDNLSIDLIYGTPGLSDAAWKANLAKVAELGIPHFSAYALTVEEKTALYHNIKTLKAAPVDPEQAAGQFELLMDEAAKMGYEHYEISNLAKPGRYAVHNTNYWRGLPYIGIGPSAHSFDGRTRGWNVANNALYARAILETGKQIYEEETLTPADRINEYIMTALRTMWGCDLAKISIEWGSALAMTIEKSSHLFQEKRWVVQDGSMLRLTSDGKLFADKIAAELFVTEKEMQ